MNALLVFLLSVCLCLFATSNHRNDNPLTQNTRQTTVYQQEQERVCEEGETSADCHQESTATALNGPDGVSLEGDSGGKPPPGIKEYEKTQNRRRKYYTPSDVMSISRSDTVIPDYFGLKIKALKAEVCDEPEKRTLEYKVQQTRRRMRLQKDSSTSRDLRKEKIIMDYQVKTVPCDENGRPITTPKPAAPRNDSEITTTSSFTTTESGTSQSTSKPTTIMLPTEIVYEMVTKKTLTIEYTTLPTRFDVPPINSERPTSLEMETTSDINDVETQTHFPTRAKATTRTSKKKKFKTTEAQTEEDIETTTARKPKRKRIKTTVTEVPDEDVTEEVTEETTVGTSSTRRPERKTIKTTVTETTTRRPKKRTTNEKKTETVIEEDTIEISTTRKKPKSTTTKSKKKEEEEEEEKEEEEEETKVTRSSTKKPQISKEKTEKKGKTLKDSGREVDDEDDDDDDDYDDEDERRYRRHRRKYWRRRRGRYRPRHRHRYKGSSRGDNNERRTERNGGTQNTEKDNGILGLVLNLPQKQK